MATPRTLPLRPFPSPTSSASSAPGNKNSMTSTYNMEALTTALTLEPGSVADHPAYRILYKNNQSALDSFITYAKSITYEEAAAIPAFCKAILDDEKGDDVSYTIIEPNMTKLRMTSSSTPDMPAILDSITKLLEIRERFLLAGVRYFSFDCWYSMVRGFFINNNDPELLALLQDAPAQALENFLRFRSEFSNPVTQKGYKSDLDELKITYIQRHRDLMSYKRKMQRELGSFRSIHAKIDEHLKQLSTQRNAEKQKQKDRLARRLQLKERTLDNAIQQIGQQGTESLTEDVADALDDMHEALFEEHFDINPNKEDQKVKDKDEEVQKEILARPYNLVDADRKPKRIYVIRFGQGADREQFMADRSRVRDDGRVAVPEIDLNANGKKAIDLETLRTKTPSSMLYDRQALEWMTSNYGQGKVGGLKDVWKFLNNLNARRQDGPELRKERPKQRGRLKKRSAPGVA